MPITQSELDVLEKMLFTDGVAGSKEEFYKEYGQKPLGNFIRSLIGLEESAVEKAFTDFLQAGSLRADQITFTRTLMAYFIKNGVLDKTLLYESPFTDINDQSLNGLFEDAKVIQLVRIIDGINNNATLA